MIHRLPFDQNANLPLADIEIHRICFRGSSPVQPKKFQSHKRTIVAYLCSCQILYKHRHVPAPFYCGHYSKNWFGSEWKVEVFCENTVLANLSLGDRNETDTRFKTCGNNLETINFLHFLYRRRKYSQQPEWGYDSGEMHKFLSVRRFISDKWKIDFLKFRYMIQEPNIR